MKKALVIFATFALASLSVVSAQTKIIIRLENTMNIERTEVVAIPWSEIKAQYPAINETKVVITDMRTATEVPYQLERKGELQVQNLLLYASVTAKGYREYAISEGKPTTFTSKTHCRYVPERKDDFAWENDRIAYRMYGKALEGTNENAYGTDVWTKYVDYLVIDKWYKLNDYHNDNGEGQDFYKVGFTLGAGDIAPYEEGKIWYSNNYRRWKILDNGPLRSTFKLEYDAWDVSGKQVTVNKTISIDAGSQLNKVEAEYNWDNDKPLNLVAGVVKRKNTGVILLNEQQGLLGYWEPIYGKSGTVGVACLFDDATEMDVANGQITGKVKLNKPGKVTYYNGAVWDKAGIITTADAWFTYLYNAKAKINTPLSITIKTQK